MKARIFVLGTVSALALTGAALADGAEGGKNVWSGSLTVTSDYRFRGISQSDRNTAIQGNVELNSQSTGIFIGAWASNVDFAGTTADDASSEIDLYAGYRYSFSEATELAAKLTYYTYPGQDDDLDYYEIGLALSHDLGGMGLKLAVDYTPDYFGKTGPAFNYSAGVDYKVMDSMYMFKDGLSLSANVGQQGFNDNAATGIPDYVYYDVGMTAQSGSFALDVRYVGTDLETADCGNDWCEGGVVVSGTLNFGG